MNEPRVRFVNLILNKQLMYVVLDDKDGEHHVKFTWQEKPPAGDVPPESWHSASKAEVVNRRIQKNNPEAPAWAGF